MYLFQILHQPVLHYSAVVIHFPYRHLRHSRLCCLYYSGEGPEHKGNPTVRCKAVTEQEPNVISPVFES